MDIEQLKYPIGRYKPADNLPETAIKTLIDDIAEAPRNFRQTVSGLSEEQLNTPYREGGWTVRQVIHHVPDSHMNAYIRFKLALTEERPVIKPYHENLWAELRDSQHTPVDISLGMLELLHTRWVTLLRSMSAGDFKRTLYHPEYQKEFTLEWMLGMYAWHGKHHRAHIASLKERKGW